MPGAGLLAVTSADRLHAEWRAASTNGSGSTTKDGGQSTIESLLEPLAPDAHLVTVLDGHPATLAWLGGVGSGRSVSALGVERFGQTGDIPDLYRAYGIDAAAILNAAATGALKRLG
jgi:pyruvate dehydrogenase E1 component